jgi:flagellar hook-associated protein 2
VTRITTSTGLVSGIPIEDTVNKLMEVAARPRTQLESRNKTLSSEQSGIDQLASLTLSLQFSLTRIKSTSTYESVAAKSGNEDYLTAKVKAGGKPQAGSYKVTPLQTATAHQVVSASLGDISEGLGSGKLKIGIGGHVNKGIALAELNAGTGVRAGKIKITDQAGATATIDLRAARSVDDVLTAISSNTDIQVTATAVGDSFVLTDTSGGTGSLAVTEVGAGRTAADLGIAGSTNAATLTGADVLRISNNTKLSSLRDGLGVELNDSTSVPEDIVIQLANGDPELRINLSGAKTVGDVIAKINAAAPNKLTARIASDGRRIEVEDLSGGIGTFSISNFGASKAAEQLGLVGVKSGAGVLSGDRLQSGLADSLISNLNGGRGAALGVISIADRAGNAAVNVNLTSAETLSEVVKLINDSPSTVTAEINTARNGLIITDNTTGTNQFTIADVSGNAAAKLGFAKSTRDGAINTGGLNRQIVSEATQLSTLVGGTGVTLGDIRLTDSAGRTGVIDLNSSGSEAKTIGDVIDRINALNIAVEARINDAGDGLVVIDTAGGASKLSVSAVSGSVASALGIEGQSSKRDNVNRQILSGSTSGEVDLSNLTTKPADIQLASLNGGEGVNRGVFRVTASNKKSFFVDLSKPGAEAFTVGDVVDKINAQATAAGVAVKAQVNSGGTGIQIIDSASGSEKLTVEDIGGGRAARDLKLLGEGSALSGKRQQIDGVGLFAAAKTNQSSLDNLAARVNDLNIGVIASVVDYGQGDLRLVIASEQTGSVNELLIDSGQSEFSFSDVNRPQDAALQIGAANAGGAVVTSATNDFGDVVDGLELSVEEGSGETVSVTVSTDTTTISKSVDDLVKSFNSVRDFITKTTDFDAESNTTGILFGRSEPLRVETELSRIVTGTFSGVGKYRSLQDIGVSLGADGKLAVDTSKLTAALTEFPDEVQKLLADPDRGVAKRLEDATKKIAGDGDSLLTTRSKAIGNTIDANNARLDQWDSRLERQRERLLLQYYALENTLAKFQDSLSALDSIQSISLNSN